MTNPTYAENLITAFGQPHNRFTSGQGSYLYDSDNNAYLDFLSGIAVTSLGHCHPEITKTIQKQAAQLVHVSNFFETPPQVQAAYDIRAITALSFDETCLKQREQAYEAARVFFVNSGTEANEAALKIVRLAYKNRISEGEPPRILALTNSFHGRSLGALAATYKPTYRKPFEPLPYNVTFVEPTIEAFNAEFDSSVAGVILEVVQGEAGVLPLDQDFLWHVRHQTQQLNSLLIVDEVQTGMGRTGQWMAHHSLDKEDGEAFIPDIVTLAKALGNGYPIGAVVALTQQAANVFTPGDHGTTFGGNPLGTAVASAVIRTMRGDALLNNARNRGADLREKLQEIQGVIAVRQQGLLIGVDLNSDASAVVKTAMKNGLVINATGPSTIRIAPPLTVTSYECEEFIEKFTDTIREAQ